MAKFQVIDFDVYRWRYAIGYFITIVAFFGLMVVASLYILGGVSEAERNAATQSTALSLKNFEPWMIVDIPYYLLQKTAFYAVGVGPFTIKLPSIILGLIAAVGIVLLLRTWFRQNVAILTALIGATAGPFLLATLSGTPSILYILWPTWILLSASMLTHSKRFKALWKIILFASIAASLYTPLSLYVLLPLLAVCLLHPHLRHTLNNLKKIHLSIALVIFLAIISPLVYCIVVDTSVAFTLLGVPNHFELMANLTQLKHQYLGFLFPSYEDIFAPVYGLPLVLLALVGIYRIITAKHTAKSYILVGWLLLLVPIVILSPELFSVTFVPFLLLVGYGIELLIRSWYQLFPKNPYARIAGLAPLCVLIVGLTLSGIDRFVYGYLYASADERIAAQDLTILKKELPKIATKDNVVHLYVSSSEAAFYQAAARHDKEFKHTSVTTVLPSATKNIVASHDVAKKPVGKPERILVNSSSKDSDRFYIYKKVEK